MSTGRCWPCWPCCALRGVRGTDASQPVAAGFKTSPKSYVAQLSCSCPLMASKTDFIGLAGHTEERLLGWKGEVKRPLIDAEKGEWCAKHTATHGTCYWSRGTGRDTGQKATLTWCCQHMQG